MYSEWVALTTGRQANETFLGGASQTLQLVLLNAGIATIGRPRLPQQLHGSSRTCVGRATRTAVVLGHASVDVSGDARVQRAVGTP